MDITVSSVTTTGGLVIETEFFQSGEGNKYLIIIGTSGEGGKTLWEGGPGKLEAMCESHSLLIDACLQMLHAKNGDDSDEETNAYYSIKEALRRADVLPPEKTTDSDDDLPF